MKHLNLIILLPLFIIGCGGSSNKEKLIDEPIRLTADQHNQYPFSLEKNTLYEIKMEVKNCSEKPCCSLQITNGSDTPISGFNYDSSSEDTNNIARILLDSPVNATIYAKVTGLKNCSYLKPTISLGTNTQSTQVTASLQGQEVNGSAKFYSNIELTKVENRYFLKDTSRRSESGLRGDASIETKKFIRNIHKFSNPQLLSHHAETVQELDPQGVDAFAGSLITFDYFKKTFGIKSYDNEGSDMIAITHLDYPIVPMFFCGTIIQPGELFNAFWNGRNIAYTPAVGNRLSLASALSVTAHEWAHAITDSYSNLQYSRESGALNEAFSDWVGIAVTRDNGHTSWKIGEETNTAIRSLKEPSLFGQPDTYKGNYWTNTDTESCPVPDVCTNDYCGVHKNSGVPNKMFYLLAAGGTHNGITITGLGIKTAIQIAFDANANYWTNTTDFADAKLGMANAAASYGQEAVEQVNLAWQAVGVN